MEEPTLETAPKQPIWRRALPFVLAVALVGFVLARLDFPAFVDNLAHVHALSFLGFALAFLVALLSADTFATAFVYRRAIGPVRFRDFWVLRGASYLPSLLNHHVGQAFVAFTLSRSLGVPLARVAGATLVVYASWFGSLLGLGCLAIVLTHRSLAWVALALALGLGYLAILAAKPARLANLRLLAPLFEAGVTGHLLALAVRIPHLVVLFLGTWLSFGFFGVSIPFADAIATVPVLMVVVTLPLTPQGFGTRDMLAAAFFESFAPGATHEARLAALAAATTSWGLALTVAEAALGLLLLRRALPASPPPTV